MEIKEVFEPILNFVKNFQKKEKDISKQAAKDRLKLVLMQDRASVSPDFFEMMKKEIIDVIKKYIEIDEESLEVQLTRGYEAGLEGPALYANIPIKNIKPVASSGEEIDEESLKEITDSISEDILEEASKLTEDGNTVVKAEIEEADSQEEIEIQEETENQEDLEIQKEEVENQKEEVEEEPKSADVIAENVAKEMKKSATKSTGRRTTRKKTNASKE